MNRLAYDSLAREVLWLLLDSGRLRPATLDRMVAWEVWFLPPRIDLALPDEDRFAELLNPRTRAEHAAMLAASLMHVVTTEDRDGWVVWTQSVSVEVRYAEGQGRPSATPVYAPRPELRALPQQGEDGEALLKVRMGAETLWLKRGDGLVPVSRGARRPRVTLLEAVEPADAVAWLVASGPVRIEHGDGRVETKPPRSLVPVERDVRIQVRGAGLRSLWQRLTLDLEVLGASRLARPSIELSRGADSITWNRNRELRLVVGEAVDTRLVAPGLDLELTSEPGDEVVIHNRRPEPALVGWGDGALRIEAGGSVRVLAAHLRSLGDGAITVRTQGATAAPPRLMELQGRLQIAAGDATRDPIFGFERSVATVWQDGVLLGGDAQVVRVPVDDAALVRPLLRIAFDGCDGAKVMPLDAAVTAGELDLAPGVWTWAPDVLTVGLPGLRMRLEAVAGRSRLIFGRPLRVCEVSADPDDRWQLHGWRFRIAANGLAVSGTGGGDALMIDHQEVGGPALLPPAAEHHVQTGSGMYRIVRRTGRAPMVREA